LAATQRDYSLEEAPLTAKFRHLDSFPCKLFLIFASGNYSKSRALPFLLLNRGGISIALCRRQQKETYNENGTIGEQ